MGIGHRAPLQGDTSGPKLASLAPHYSDVNHGVYFNILKRAISEQPDIQNIALAGTYGTGKSSILKRVGKEYEDRVIELSLLTLGVQPDTTGAPQESNPSAMTTTNRIQKEIVKQLLYQQRPTDAPESRFRRIVRFRWRHELVLAAGAGLLIAILAFIAGLDIALKPNVKITFAERPRFVAVSTLYLALAVLASGVLLSVRAFIRGRVGIESVTAGPATITLPPRSTSYFDEYLDEIIYFFEINSQRDIVIIEDLDRFNDPHIFEALRSLNLLLNSARQLQHRNIRFIYAVRDSVFEKLGHDEGAQTSDDARDELIRANRTKFFELVIPVVPFITHRNARDLMHSLLMERGHQISKDLIDLAARHVADMRLIHNIINEYEVFKHRLLDVDNPVPELDPERLFAMVLFKNTHVGDFEKIRHADSSLDALWTLWRLMVNQNIESIREDSKLRRSGISERRSASTYAKNLAAEIRKRINVLASAPGSGLTESTIYMDGDAVTDPQMQSIQFWTDVIGTGKKLTVLTNGSYGSRQHMHLSPQAIETLLGMSIDGQHFVSAEAAADQAQLDRYKKDLAFLRRHSWKELAGETRFRYTGKSDGVSRNFREWAQRLLPSRLAVDLVVNGYITSYYSLHVSSFYGQLIRPDAMVYILRCIDHGTPEPNYALQSDDVEAILRDQGNSVLTEPSMFNIGILNHLLLNRPKDARVVVRSLVESPYRTSFLDNYLNSGSAKLQFVQHLTEFMSGIFNYLAESIDLYPDERMQLIETAIGHQSSQLSYERSDALRQLVEREYRRLLSFVPSDDVPSHDAAVAFISWTGAVLPDVSGLPNHALESLRGTRAYSMTTANLENVVGTADLSLDSIRTVDNETFTYAIASVQSYLTAIADSPTTHFSVKSPRLFVEVLNASPAWASEDFESLVQSSHAECRISLLTDVPTPAWPALVRARRAPMTFDNIDQYMDAHAGIDSALATSLSHADKISYSDTIDKDSRTRLALNIINALPSLLTTEQKVKLALSLNPGLLDATDLEPSEGTLIGDLIEAELIVDDKEAFAARLMVDWETQFRAISSSSNFPNLVSPDTLQPQYIASVFGSDELRSIHAALADVLPSYTTLPRAALEAAAHCAIEGAFAFDARWIEMMRKGGVGITVTLELLAVANANVSLTELREILRSLGGAWAKVSDRGYGVHEIRDSPAAVTLLERLKAAEIVSKLPLEGTVRRVSLRKP